MSILNESMGKNYKFRTLPLNNTRNLHLPHNYKLGLPRQLLLSLLLYMETDMLNKYGRRKNFTYSADLYSHLQYCVINASVDNTVLQFQYCYMYTTIREHELYMHQGQIGALFFTVFMLLEVTTLSIMNSFCYLLVISIGL